MSVVSEHWVLTPPEIHILLRSGVPEKYEKNPPEWYSETFSAEQQAFIQNILKNAREIQDKDDTMVPDYINRQEPWLREALIVMVEEEIKSAGKAPG